MTEDSPGRSLTPVASTGLLRQSGIPHRDKSGLEESDVEVKAHR